MEAKNNNQSAESQHDHESDQHSRDHGDQHRDGNSQYWRFAAMIAASTVIMHLLTFTNVSRLGHIDVSQVRIYMSIMMGSAMAIVMLLFMKRMYKNKTINRVILIGSAVVFIAMFWMIRNQTGISDEAWIRAMIPHHSSAIMTSENANITDPEVRRLADEIIRTQEEEIAEMRQMLEDLQSGAMD